MTPLAPTVLVFDSGVGGLTVFREIVAARPDATYAYVADDAGIEDEDNRRKRRHGRLPTSTSVLMRS